MPPDKNLLQTWLALFRGINVGGHHRLPMRDLVSIFQGLGLQDSKTYIQSGNVVFRSAGSVHDKTAARIVDSVEKRHAFRPHIHMMPAEDLFAVIQASPFDVDDPKTLHCFFLSEQPDAPDLDKLHEIKRTDEEFLLAKDVFYLHAPQGIGRSKLVQRVETLLGVPTTARNWRTVTKIAEIARQFDQACSRAT